MQTSATICSAVCLRQAQLTCKMNQSSNLLQVLWVMTVKQQRDTGFRLWKGPGRQALLERGRWADSMHNVIVLWKKQVCKTSTRRQDDSRKGAPLCFVQANFNRASTTSHRKLLHSPIHLSLSASFPDVWVIFFFSLASSNKSLNSWSPPLGHH